MNEILIQINDNLGLILSIIGLELKSLKKCHLNLLQEHYNI